VRILIADGATKVRSALALLVQHRQAEAEIVQAESVPEVSRLAARMQIDVALVDWSLPQGGGEAALATLRRFWPEAYIVILSGRPEVEDKARAVSPDAFVSKGNPPDDLEQILDSIADCDPALAPRTSRRSPHPDGPVASSISMSERGIERVDQSDMIRSNTCHGVRRG
jgi:DNA-binding NarL/FixJ family response regulator